MRLNYHSRYQSPSDCGPLWRRLLTLLALLSLLLPTLTLADELLRQRLSELQAQDRPSLAGVRLASAKLLAAAYGERGFAYAWGRAGQVTDLLALAARSEDDGLHPADFHVAVLDKILPGGDPGALKGEDRVTNAVEGRHDVREDRKKLERGQIALAVNRAP